VRVLAAAADPVCEAVLQWVENAFRAYLRCGILPHGFTRIRCDACTAAELLEWACEVRGWGQLNLLLVDGM
jgi:hypothetical protein